MKTAIVTVGTSVFENYFNEEKNKDFDKNKITYYRQLKNRSYSEYEDEKGRVDRLRDAVWKWANGNPNSSAEIKSLIKICEK